MFGLESSNATMQSEVYVVLAAASVCFLSFGLYPLYQDPQPPETDNDLSRLAAEMDASTPTFVFTAKHDGWELGHADPPDNVKSRINEHLIPLISKLSEERNYDVLEIRGHTDGISHDARISTMDARKGEGFSDHHERLTAGSDGFYAASNAELGLQRALQVKAIFDASKDDGKLGNIKHIQAFSAGEFIRPDGGSVDGSDSRPDPERRRVEIRLSRLPACGVRTAQECSKDSDCVWVAKSVGCVSRKYSPCFQYESEAQCDEDEPRCQWMSLGGIDDGPDARAECVPREFMDWVSSAIPVASPPVSVGPIADLSRHRARKNACVLDGTRSGKNKGPLGDAKKVCAKLVARGWECEAAGYLYARSGRKVPARSGYSSYIVFVKDEYLVRELKRDLVGTMLGAKVDHDPGVFHGPVGKMEVTELPECRNVNAVLFVGTDFADRSPTKH